MPVPDGILKAICQPEKARKLPPRPDRPTLYRYPQYLAPAHRHHSPGYTVIDRRPAGFRNTPWATSTPRVLNITENEARFWIGIEVPSGTNAFTRCRLCNWNTTHIMLAAEARKQRKKHQDLSGCPAILRVVYEKALKMQKCAVCGTHTQSKKWGIPLCLNICQAQWPTRSVYDFGFEFLLQDIRRQYAEAAPAARKKTVR